MTHALADKGLNNKEHGTIAWSALGMTHIAAYQIYSFWEGAGSSIVDCAPLDISSRNSGEDYSKLRYFRRHYKWIMMG